MKEHFTKFIFSLALIIGLTMSVSAQDNDKKKKEPRRPDPPKIVVPKKPKPPKDDNRDKKKKPDNFAVFVQNEEYSE